MVGTKTVIHQLDGHMGYQVKELLCHKGLTCKNYCNTNLLACIKILPCEKYHLYSIKGWVLHDKPDSLLQ